MLGFFILKLNIKNDAIKINKKIIVINGELLEAGGGK